MKGVKDYPPEVIDRIHEFPADSGNYFMPWADYAALEAKLERMEKAGNAMAELHHAGNICCPLDAMDVHREGCAYKNWLAALTASTTENGG